MREEDKAWKKILNACDFRTVLEFRLVHKEGARIGESRLMRRIEYKAKVRQLERAKQLEMSNIRQIHIGRWVRQLIEQMVYRDFYEGELNLADHYKDVQTEREREIVNDMKEYVQNGRGIFEDESCF